MRNAQDRDTLRLVPIVIAQHQCAAEDATRRLNVKNAKAKAMKNKKQTTKENKYIPFSFPVRSKISWWKKQGSFNVELYMALCQAKKD